jgi:hypothetical protein
MFCCREWSTWLRSLHAVMFTVAWYMVCGFVAVSGAEVQPHWVENT